MGTTRRRSHVRRTKTGKIERVREHQLNTGDKEPYQMTRKEYENAFGTTRTNVTVTGGFSRHKEQVMEALNRGLTVPDRVLNDYPELKEYAEKLKIRNEAIAKYRNKQRMSR